MPMTFDTYSNCSYGCLYCFSQFQRALGLAKESYLKKEVKPVNVDRVKRIFNNPDSSQFGNYVKARKVMQWGGLSDQFDNYERKYGTTLELLKFFKSIDYPLCFSTKSVWWTKDSRYMDLFKGQKNWNVKFSIITTDEQKAKVMESGCPTPMERLQAIERIAKAGAGGSTLRLRPFIIGVSTPSYLDLIQDAASAGAAAVSTEFFCMDTRSAVLRQKADAFNKLCSFDLFQFYKTYSSGSGYLRLNRNVKRPFVNNMKRLCEQLGIRFYVSDAHFKECCSNGSCCGLPEDWNYSRGQWCEALQIAKKNGKVSYEEVSFDVNLLLSGFSWHSAEGFNANSSERKAKFEGMSMAEYMRWLWNNPQAGQSPYKLFGGIMVPGEKDEFGDIVYYYDEKKSL